MSFNSPDVILITSTDLESGGVGSLFLKDLIEDNKKIRVTCFLIERYLTPSKIIKNRILGLVLERLLSKLKVFQWGRFFLFKNKALKININAIIKKTQYLQSKKIWITASSPELIFLARKLIDIGMDVRLMVWDAPEYFLLNQSMYSRTRRNILNDFYFLLKNSKSVSVISDSMNEMYENYLPTKGLVIRHGIKSFFIKKNNEEIQSEINFVFAGSLYAKSEWNAFVETLEAQGWVVDGIKINLYFIGNFPLKGAYKSETVSYLGQMSFDDTMHFMSKMHVGYLPYPFGEENIIVAKTSFPGKMSAYAAAGLYIFHHAPQYTEVTDFLKKYPFGISCDALDQKTIEHSLKCVVNFVKNSEFNGVRLEAVETELSQDIMIERLNKFLSI